MRADCIEAILWRYLYSENTIYHMKSINIFIAGAKELAPQRVQLKALVSDINHKFEEANKGIRLNVSSYETFGNKQEEYNDFITNKADLIMLVLKDRIGSHTEDEYLLALNNKNKTGRPDIVVFLQQQDELTTDIAYINGLLKNEDYYYSYVNDEDLILKAKDYIEAFATMSFTPKKFNPRQMQVVTKTSNADIPNRHFGQMGKWIISILSLLLLAALLTITYLMHQKNLPQLIFSGGGSAKNFIESTHDIDLENYPNSLYIHLPSESAWALIKDEAITTEDNYYPICLSASPATAKDFLQSAHDDVKKLNTAVIALQLGTDPMIVWVDSTTAKQFDSKDLKDGIVNVRELGNLLTESNLNVYATNPKSGTRSTYSKIFDSICNFDLDKLHIDVFSLETKKGAITPPYVILGSSCYYVKALQSGCHKLAVVDDEETPFEKSILLYFMGYRNFQGKQIYVDEDLKLLIPDPTYNFLKDLGIPSLDKIIGRENDHYYVTYQQKAKHQVLYNYQSLTPIQ